MDEERTSPVKMGRKSGIAGERERYILKYRGRAKENVRRTKGSEKENVRELA